MIGPPTRGSLLKELDLEPEQFLDLVRLAAELKAAKAERREVPRLSGRNIALVFQKASTRTRCAFEVAAFDQGARVTYLGPEGSHLGREESVPDTARVLGRMYRRHRVPRLRPGRPSRSSPRMPEYLCGTASPTSGIPRRCSPTSSP